MRVADMRDHRPQASPRRELNPTIFDQGRNLTRLFLKEGTQVRGRGQALVAQTPQVTGYIWIILFEGSWTRHDTNSLRPRLICGIHREKEEMYALGLPVSYPGCVKPKNESVEAASLEARSNQDGAAADITFFSVRYPTARCRVHIASIYLYLSGTESLVQESRVVHVAAPLRSPSSKMANEAEFGASPLAGSKRADAHAGMLKTGRIMEPRALELDDDDDMEVLYGDLVEAEDGSSTSAASHASTLLKLKISKLQGELHASEETANAFAEELGRLREANTELAEKNRTLEHNISSLFNTAKLEIERKDAEIRRLRNEPPANAGHQGRGHQGRSRSQSSGRRPPGSNHHQTR